VLFHYILKKCRTTVLDKLGTLALADEPFTHQWLKKSAPPPFDFHRS
jgi:hypothetical protein